MSEQPGSYFVRSVERAFRVLRTFTEQQPELTLTEVAQASGLDRAGARRLLLTHLQPWVDAEEILAEAAAEFDGPVEVVEAAREYEV